MHLIVPILIGKILVLMISDVWPAWHPRSCSILGTGEKTTPVSTQSLCFSGMLHVDVALPSGKGTSLAILQSSKVGDLRILAQKSLEKTSLRLVTAEGRDLDPLESLQSAGLRDGDRLTAVVQMPKVAATNTAFALWFSGADGIATWGSSRSGGDSSEVQGQLRHVKQVRATRHGAFAAFAAILADGSVVTWGDRKRGGDCSAVQDQLRNVQQIQATDTAFAAILANGSVVTWGNPDDGGDCSAVQGQLKTCIKFRLQRAHLPQSWPMDQWLLGAIQTGVVTAWQFEIS